MFELFNRTNSLYEENATRLIILKCMVYHEKVRDIQLKTWFLKDDLVFNKIDLRDIHIEIINFKRRGFIEVNHDDYGDYYKITEEGIKYYNSGTLLNHVLQSTQNNIFLNIQKITIAIALFALVAKFFNFCTVLLVLVLFISIGIHDYMIFRSRQELRKKELQKIIDNNTNHNTDQPTI